MPLSQSRRKKTPLTLSGRKTMGPGWDGTGSVSCNSAFVLHLCHCLNQEELMEREAMV